MAITSYPFDGQGITEAQFSKMFRELRGDGIAASADSDAMQVSVSDTTVTVQPGFGFVQGFFVDIDSLVTKTILLPPTGSFRTDRIVLRCDPGANAITVEVLQGEQGTGAPSLTQVEGGVWEVPLASIYSQDGSAPEVSDERRFVGLDNFAWTTNSRPLSPRLGQSGYNRDIHQWEFWDGMQWGLIYAPARSYRVFKSSDVWTVPPNVYEVDVLAVSGGSGGVGGTYQSSPVLIGPTTGAPPHVVVARSVAVKPGSAIPVTVGAGGAGGAGGTSGSGSAGGAGGDTSFGDLVVAPNALSVNDKDSGSGESGSIGDPTYGISTYFNARRGDFIYEWKDTSTYRLNDNFNTSFDSPIGDFTPNNCTWSAKNYGSSYGYGGSMVCTIAGDMSITSKSINVGPYGFRTYISITKSQAAQSIDIVVTWYDAQGAVVSSKTATAVGVAVNTTTGGAVPCWITGTAPQNAATARLTILVHGSNANDEIRVWAAGYLDTEPWSPPLSSLLPLQTASPGQDALDGSQKGHAAMPVYIAGSWGGGGTGGSGVNSAGAIGGAGGDAAPNTGGQGGHGGNSYFQTGGKGGNGGSGVVVISWIGG